MVGTAALRRFRAGVWDNGHTGARYGPKGQDGWVWPPLAAKREVLAITARTLDQTSSGDPGFAGIHVTCVTSAEPARRAGSRQRWPTMSTHLAPFLERGVHGSREVPSPW